MRALFTGIVQGMATVKQLEDWDSFRRLLITFPPAATQGIQIGASVALNGTCLTVTNIHDNDSLSFDVIGETLRATNLGTLEAGSAVNFERSARVGDEIGGHNVSGHVHTTARVSDVQSAADNRALSFEVDDKWMKYILPKGFIAINGCSLTVGEVTSGGFNVYLIPETLRVTVLGALAAEDFVNLEIDSQTQAIVDTVEKVVARYATDHLTPITL